MLNTAIKEEQILKDPLYMPFDTNNSDIKCPYFSQERYRFN